MKIINKTKWQTKDLKKFINTSIDNIKHLYDRFNRNNLSWSFGDYKRNLKVKIVTGGYSGCAYYNGRSMTIRIPKVYYVDNFYIDGVLQQGEIKEPVTV